MPADYDVSAAIERIENELIDSMMRNLKLHLKEEQDMGFDWMMWQTEQLKHLEEYRKKNASKYGKQFKSINRRLEHVLTHGRTYGQKEEELRILQALKEHPELRRVFKQSGYTRIQGGNFFKINESKLESLIKATTNDMEKAEYAVLRRCNDQYRKIIFDAQMYANTGAGTVEKAVDMATHDFLMRGIDCVQYANGARHTLSDYADMAIRTAERRAYLMGAGEMRKKWGVSLVIVNRRGTMTNGNYGTACPKCIPWLGKILIDDVYSDGRPDGKHELLSTAIQQGFLHPRCRDSFTTYFPGVTEAADPVTKEELQKGEEQERQEARQNYTELMAEKFGRLAKYSLDPDNKRKYEARAEQLAGERSRMRSYGESPEYERNVEIDKCKTSGAIEKLFPEISFLDGFRNMPLNVQREIAQGFSYMRDIFGTKAMPVTCNASRIKDYGKTKLKLKKIMIRQDIGIGDAFATTCHEAVHVYDYNRGLISDSILDKAFMKLGIKKNSREADELVLDLLGWKLYNKYRNDNSELLAYAFEESLFKSENKLVNAIMEQFIGSIL